MRPNPKLSAQKEDCSTDRAEEFKRGGSANLDERRNSVREFNHMNSVIRWSRDVSVRAGEHRHVSVSARAAAVKGEMATPRYGILGLPARRTGPHPHRRSPALRLHVTGCFTRPPAMRNLGIRIAIFSSSSFCVRRPLSPACGNAMKRDRCIAAFSGAKANVRSPGGCVRIGFRNGR